MAKYQGSLPVNSKYTYPFDVEYDIYKGGIFEGYGDSSYISLKIGGKEVGKRMVSKEKLDAFTRIVRDFISFIECSKFDIITQNELDFINSDSYRYLIDILGVNPIKFNSSYTEMFVECHECGFTKDDVGKNWMDFYHCTGSNDIKRVWNDKNNCYDEFYVGNVIFKDSFDFVDIPIIRPNVKKVEIMQIKANVNIYKCVAFVGKLNALYDLLYEKRFTNYVVWNYALNLYNSDLERKLSAFHPNFCPLKIVRY